VELYAIIKTFTCFEKLHNEFLIKDICGEMKGKKSSVCMGKVDG